MFILIKLLFYQNEQKKWIIITYNLGLFLVVIYLRSVSNINFYSYNIFSVLISFSHLAIMRGSQTKWHHTETKIRNHGGETTSGLGPDSWLPRKHEHDFVSPALVDFLRDLLKISQCIGVLGLCVFNGRLQVRHILFLVLKFYVQLLFDLKIWTGRERFLMYNLRFLKYYFYPMICLLSITNPLQNVLCSKYLFTNILNKETVR